MEELSPGQFKERMSAANIVLLDARVYHAFASQHIPGVWHLDLNDNFPTFAGWVLPTDKDILLIADDYTKALEANTWARRVGVDSIVGYLDGGMVAWAVAGFKTSHIELTSAEDLHDMITSTISFVLLDVRAPLEYADTHIKGAINIPVAELRTRHHELNKDKTTVLICSSGNRSALGASILKQHGFNDVYNVAGGLSGYSAAGYIRECRVCVNPHGSRFFTNFSEVQKHWDTE
jgi:rhodanese-related sulfurtransferase